MIKLTFLSIATAFLSFYIDKPILMLLTIVFCICADIKYQSDLLRIEILEQKEDEE